MREAKPTKKQIMSARQCAALQKRFAEINSNDATDQFHMVWQARRRRNSDCRGVAGSGAKLPCIVLNWSDSQGEGEGMVLLASDHRAAKIIRQYLFSILPRWPDVDTAPGFNGFIQDEDYQWFDMNAPLSDSSASLLLNALGLIEQPKAPL